MTTSDELTDLNADMRPTGDWTADLCGELSVWGNTHPVPLPATVEHAGDGTVQISTKTTMDKIACRECRILRLVSAADGRLNVGSRR